MLKRATIQSQKIVIYTILFKWFKNKSHDRLSIHSILQQAAQTFTFHVITLFVRDDVTTLVTYGEKIVVGAKRLPQSGHSKCCSHDADYFC